MLKLTHALAATAALMMAGTIAAEAANVLQVKKRTEVEGKAEDLWKKYGGFCAISEWHPAVAKCEESKEGELSFRTLTLKDGATIKEKLNGKSEDGYTYAITESPLPVKDYNASFSIRPDDEPGKAVITWSATFMAKGKPDADAKGVIQGVFDAGVKAIEDKEGGAK